MRLFKRKTKFLSWSSYKKKIDNISLNNFQQDTRTKSLRNEIRNEKLFY